MVGGYQIVDIDRIVSTKSNFTVELGSEEDNYYRQITAALSYTGDSGAKTKKPLIFKADGSLYSNWTVMPNYDTNVPYIIFHAPTVSFENSTKSFKNCYIFTNYPCYTAERSESKIKKTATYTFHKYTKI